MKPKWFKPWAGALVFALAFGVLGVDMFAWHGLGIWIWYYLPLLLSFSVGGRFFPLWTASLLSVLMAVGFCFSPPGMEFYLALANRCMGLGVLWVMALLIFYRRRTMDELRRVNRAQTTSRECNRVLVRAKAEAELLNEVCRVIVEEGGYRLAWVGFAEHDEAKTVRPVAWAGFAGGYMEKLNVTWADIERGQGSTGTAIRTGRAAVCHDLASDPTFVPGREQAVQFGLASSLVLPLSSKDGVFGALSIYAATRNAFDAAEEKLLSGLADDLAFGIQALRAHADSQRAEAAIRRLNSELEERVRRRTQELSESEARFRTIYDTAPVSIWLEDWTEVIAMVESLRAEGVTDFEAWFREHPDVVSRALQAVKIQDVNQWTLGMFKARNKADLLASLGTVFATPDTLPGFIGELVALAQGQTVYHTEMALNTATGDEIHGLLAMAFPPPGSGAGHALVSLIDITERKCAEEQIRQLNEELRQRAAQLEVANQELEAFAYSVSHDLRAPLRAIDGFSRILLEEHAGQLNAEGREHLDRVSAATRHMGRLIDDLLALSRVTRSEMRRCPVNLSDTATRIAAELKRADPARPVEFNIQPGLTAHGDPNLLRILLDNLLGNAWKFTGKQSQVKIEFGCTAAAVGDRQNEETNGADGSHHPPLQAPVFFVRDNGVGFDMAYAKNLFGAFQRLHSVAEFPGSGIGLATVQRIIHRHGGRVWAESQPGHGAVFYFTLPSTPNEAQP